MNAYWLLKINPVGAGLGETHKFTSPHFAREAFRHACCDLINIEVWLIYFAENPYYPGHLSQYNENHWHMSQEVR